MFRSFGAALIENEYFASILHALSSTLKGVEQNSLQLSSSLISPSKFYHTKEKLLACQLSSLDILPTRRYQALPKI